MPSKRVLIGKPKCAIYHRVSTCDQNPLMTASSRCSLTTEYSYSPAFAGS
jgi:hypothetical protein